MSFGKPHRAILISLIITSAAVAAFVPIYERLLAEQRPPGAVSDLEYGKHGYLLEDPSGKCAGWFRYELEFDGAYSFLFDGNIRYSLNAKPGGLEFHAGAAFNSLNQLSATYVRLVHQDNEYLIRTDGVTPIRISFSGTVKGKDVSLRQVFPGPVEIYEPQEGKFLIRSQSFPQLEKVADQVTKATPFKPVLPFKVREQQAEAEEDLKELCSAKGEQPIELDALEKIFNRVRSIVMSRV